MVRGGGPLHRVQGLSNKLFLRGFREKYVREPKAELKIAWREAQKEKKKEGFYLLHLRHSVWVFCATKLQSEDFHIVFIVLMFCEAEAINMCREIKLQKKKNIKLNLKYIINNYFCT